MDQGIDTSIYGGLQTPQPANLLGMGMQGAYMANAMNQNRMFQLQMQGRQGLADIAQRHINQDGSMDYEGFVGDIFQDPRTAMLAPQIATSLYQSQLLNMQTLNSQWDLKNKQMGAMADSLGTLLGKGDRVTLKDAVNELAAQQAYGTFTIPEAANLIHHMSQMPDQTDANGNVIGNPSLAQYIRTFGSQFQQSRENFNNFTGTLQQFNTPQGLIAGRYSPVTGNVTPIAQFGQGEPQTMTDTAGGKSIVPLGNVQGFTGGGVQQIPQPGNPFTQPSAAGPTGQAPGVAPGQVQTSQAGPQNFGQQFATLFQQAEQKYGLPQGLLPAMGFQESAFNPNANGPNVPGQGNAKGLMQFMDATAKQYGVNPYDPQSAIDGAGRKMMDLLSKYESNGGIPAAIVAYQAGDAVADKFVASHGDLNTLPASTRGYLSNVLIQMGTGLQPPGIGQPQQGQGQPTQATQPQGGIVGTQQAPTSTGQQVAQQGNGQMTAPQPPSGNQPISNVVGLPPAISEYQNGTGPLGDYEKGLTDQVRADQGNNMTVNEMAQKLTQFVSGKGETMLGDVAAIAQTLGMSPSVVQEIARGNLDALQEFKKLSVPQAVSQVRVAEGPNSKVTNMLSGAFIQSQPNPEMTPGAIQNMFNFIGKLQDFHQLELKAWRQEYQYQQNLANQQGRWTPQQVQELQNFPNAWEQTLIQNKAINFDFSNSHFLTTGGGQ